MWDNNGRYTVDFKLTVNTVTFNLKVKLKVNTVTFKLKVKLKVKVKVKLKVNTATFKLKVKLNVNRVFSQFPRPTTCQPSNVCYFQI